MTAKVVRHGCGDSRCDGRPPGFRLTADFAVTKDRVALVKGGCDRAHKTLNSIISGAAGLRAEPAYEDELPGLPAIL